MHMLVVVVVKVVVMEHDRAILACCLGDSCIKNTLQRNSERTNKTSKYLIVETVPDWCNKLWCKMQTCVL